MPFSRVLASILLSACLVVFTSFQPALAGKDKRQERIKLEKRLANLEKEHVIRPHATFAANGSLEIFGIEVPSVPLNEEEKNTSESPRN